MDRLVNLLLLMQIMIADVRSTYPGIVDFLRKNLNAIKNIINVWENQLKIKQVIYGISFDRHGELHNILEPAKMNDLFAFLLLAVIDPEFMDKTMAEIIQNQGNLTASIQITQNHSEFLKNHCKSFEPMISGNFLDIGKVLEFFSSVTTSETRRFNVRYMLRNWSMAFGSIDPSCYSEFEEVTIDLESSVAIFDAFSTIWRTFFQNFARTFEASFLPIGNILWSEYKYTRLFTTNLSLTIGRVTGIIAFQIGSLDGHSYFKSKTPQYMHTEITPDSYGMFLFPDRIKQCSNIPGKLCSCFLRDFWQAHQKPNPNMTDIDYLKWLSSIPGIFSVYGRSSIDLINSLQNGTELPRIQGGSAGDYTYLSYLRAPTDPKIQQDYDAIFGEHFRRLGREPRISDFFDEPKE
jgi:hypothetical protein